MSVETEEAAGRAGRFRRRLWGLGGALLLGVAFSLLLGRYPAPYFTPPGVLRENELARTVVLNLRLPRILTAVLLGATLAAAGTTFQLIFRNPLVDAGFLGVSQGAAFGASLGIVFLGGSAAVVQGSAALFAFLGLAASYLMARRLRLGDWVLRLVMAGIGISAFYSAGTGIIKYLADPLKQLPDITFWLLGGLWAITWEDVLHILPVVIPALVVIFLMRWRLNLLSLRDATAFALGALPGRERMVMLVAATAATAAVVSKAGQIGWVGLIVPHIARRVLGADAQSAVPGGMLLGGLFVLLCDDLARTVLTGEIPLGILTSLIGAVAFFGLLLRHELELKR
ncbi:MAG TPA: iron ABC transporter permease [Anaerolineae bacterium]|nr:iron ABC transporter permease [Anaerolineae bacterium]HQH37798.1 iron ABC transporter permease [Anaerolineae bacterium]